MNTKTEYAIKISLTEHPHDNPENPYYWCLNKCDNTWHQIAFGWENSPEKCFSSAREYYQNLTDNETAY